ncbi:phospholipase [Massilia arenosa]|uniref:Phospholipase n=1 Tax=Zemynaea arenosa TaxID=2561931 RepID=A0A4Y9SHQ0_9BURK|nr:S1/P1 nuclease [Massilia arenosa]TFW24182.1 phospholipase [Massilia arenosa]
MKKLTCVLALATAFAATNAFAWGNDGHKAVGAIADKLLKGKRAEKMIKEILLPGETLASISVWPDCVKGNWCGPQTPEMLAYVAANPKHSTYHYTDVPFQLAHYHDGDVGTDEDDIVQTLKEAIAVLQGNDNEKTNPHHFTKRQALILLVHMTGDIHQPLHVGAAFVDKTNTFVVPKTKAELDNVSVFDSVGGNNLLMSEEKIAAAEKGAAIPPGEPVPVVEGKPKALTKPFHTYWDVTAVDYAFRRTSVKTYDQFAQAMIDKKPAVAANTGEVTTWPYQWADDSLVVSKEAFKDVVPGVATQQTSKKGTLYYTWPLEVPANYPVPSSDIARTQMTKAGYHLAQALEAIFPDAK